MQVSVIKGTTDNKMQLIAHRGNVNGPVAEAENKPDYVDNALKLGYDVEVDIWIVNGELFLGHDKAQYKVDIDWILDRSTKLWVHCKNIQALVFFTEFGYDVNYFWHEHDTVAITAKKYIWAYPGKQPIRNSIAVMPEMYGDDLSECVGICSDYIKRYKK